MYNGYPVHVEGRRPHSPYPYYYGRFRRPARRRLRLRYPRHGRVYYPLGRKW